MQAVKHVHADLIKEYARQYADGEIEAGWWKWEYRPQNYNNWEPAPSPSWSATKEYRFQKQKNIQTSIHTFLREIHLKLLESEKW